MHNETPIVHPSGDPLTEHYHAPPIYRGLLKLGEGLLPLLLGYIILSTMMSLPRNEGDTLLIVVIMICPGAIILFWSAKALSGLYELVGKRDTYFNPETGAMLYRGTLLGISWEGKIGSPWQHISIDIPLIEPGPYPVSISLLHEIETGRGNSRKTWGDYSTTLLKACLINLVAQDVLSLYQATTTQSSIWRKGKPETQIFLRCGENFEASLDGELENRIMMIMRDWSSHQSQYDRLLHPQGTEIREFTFRFLKHKLGGFNMVVNTALKDAAKRGLGTTNSLFMRWKPDPAHADRLHQEYERSRRFLDAFASRYPELDRALHNQIMAEILRPPIP